MAENKTHTKRRKGCTSSSTHHIRFDQEGGGDDNAALADMPSLLSNDAPSPSFSSSVVSTSDNNPPPARKNKNKQKRKRHPSTATQKGDDDSSSAITTSCAKIFNGLIVAISTLESKHNKGPTTTDNDNGSNDLYQNYKTLKQVLQTMGATISPQVHKRVHYLLSTDSAVQHLTQRVRQALKRNVDVVDVAWVKECREQNTRLNVEKYSRNELANCLMMEKEKPRGEKVLPANNEGKKGAANDKKVDEGECSDNAPEEDNGVGWSTPVQLDCCCVCHENGDDDCPWCSDCNLTLARRKKNNMN